MAIGSVFLYSNEELDIDISNGLCVNHDDPDLWFAGEVELADGEVWLNTRDQTRRVNLEVDKAITALSICKSCPAKDDCLELGMRGAQMYFGIYGGTMPGERLLKLGKSMKNKHNQNKLSFANKVRKTMRERGIDGDQAV